MRLSLRFKQVAGVTIIVALVVTALTAIQLARIARIRLEESYARGQLLALGIFEQVNRALGGTNPPLLDAVRTDPGIRASLQSFAYTRNVTYAAIVTPDGIAIAHGIPALDGRQMPSQESLAALLEQGAIEQVRAIYSDRTFEIREPLILNDRELGTIRVGVSVVLLRAELRQVLLDAAIAGLIALAVSTLIALAVAGWMLRPIHVIRSGLTRLGRGEFDVKLDLPPGDEFSDLGTSFNTISAELSASRTRLANQPAHLESLVDRLEDAVAIFSPAGELMFANPAMRSLLPSTAGRVRASDLPADHPCRTFVEGTILARRSQGPATVRLGADGEEGDVERLLVAHAIMDRDGRFVGVMLVVRNLAYLSQVQSTLSYSRKLAALGRLMAGVAHEVKNPLNAMTIHLELLKQKLSPERVSRRMAATAGVGVVEADTQAVAPRQGAGPDVLKHVSIIGQEIKRLDEVVQGFLRFSRPEELKLQPVMVRQLLDDTAAVIEPDAERLGVRVIVDAAPELTVNGDPVMLRQALLNLGLNACQAMPSGGELRFSARSRNRSVEIEVADTGVGIPPEHLARIFDLYFTTREGGSGIGLSMVYRTLQLHDGTIEVQSTPGHGTTFTLQLPAA